MSPIPPAGESCSRFRARKSGRGPITGHNGGQLQFGPDGLLYISVGDGDCCPDPAGNGQNTGTLNGKLLRINPAGTMPGQYSIPADNPFAGATPGATRSTPMGCATRTASHSTASPGI